MIAALLSALACRCGQPAVIGQILTGVLLGPTLLGRLPGHLTAHMFPPAVLPSLTSLAQVAVVTFMRAVLVAGDAAADRRLRGRDADRRTGLSLDISDIHGTALILLGLIFLIASTSKLGSAYGASRLSRLEPRVSATITALVNTRGLTKLIALNVGLQAGLINQRLFTVLVLMTLLTTLMTGPLLLVIRPARASMPAGTGQLGDLGADPQEEAARCRSARGGRRCRLSPVRCLQIHPAVFLRGLQHAPPHLENLLTGQRGDVAQQQLGHLLAELS